VLECVAVCCSLLLSASLSRMNPNEFLMKNDANRKKKKWGNRRASPTLGERHEERERGWGWRETVGGGKRAKEAREGRKERTKRRGRELHGRRSGGGGVPS